MKKQLLLIPLAVAVASCSSKPKEPAAKTVGASSGGGIFSFLSSPAIKVRPYSVRELPNGLRIYFIRDETLPRVSLQALVKVGSRQEPAELQGLNSLTAGLLDQGTTSKNAEALAEAFNALGTEFSANPGDDSTFFSASTLSPEAERLLDLFYDVLMNPGFSEKELNRKRDQYKSALKRRMDNASAFASREYEGYLYGDHPYGRDNLGTFQSLDRVRRTDLLRFYLSWYRPNNTLLAVAGRFDADFEKKVEDLFGKWGKRELKETPSPMPSPVDKLSVRLVTKPGLVQTQIRIGQIGIARADDDYIRMLLANEALGGGFGSRLMQRIRDDLGLTYSISSGVDARKVAGSFNISTFTRNDSVGRTIQETLGVFRDYVSKGITEEELATAKAQIIGQYPRGIETADGMARQLLMIDFYGRPLSYLTDFPKIVDAVKLSDVNAAIKKHMRADGLKILVYGDEKAIAAQLKDLNPEIVKAK